MKLAITVEHRARLAVIFRALLPEVLGVAGVACAVKGLAMIYAPAPWLAGGMGLLAACVLLLRVRDK